MSLVDAHIHLTDEEFLHYIGSIVTNLKAMKIKVCSVCVDNQTSLASVDLLRDPLLHNMISQFIGIHPRNANHEDVVAFGQLLETNAQHVDGIGEIGLDRTYTENGYSPYHKQLEVFESMLRLAEKYHKPISVHSRKSLDEILQLISSYDIAAVLMHWFSGNKKQLNICMDSVRRISTELLTRYPDKFASDFEQNKKLINELAAVRSKVLRNTIAGYITSYLRKNSGQKESEATSLEAEPSEQQGQDIRQEGVA